MTTSGTPARILVVDDEPLMRDYLGELLTRKRYRVKLAADGEEALALLRSEPFALVLTDWRMGEIDGIGLLRAASEISPGTRVVIMTAYATVENAVEAMKLGACDYLTKPFCGDQLERVIERTLALERKDDPFESEGAIPCREERPLVGEGPQMEEVRSLIRLAASTEATVLITGETGTGKELVARAIHEQSSRRPHRFVRLNCAALPESLFESELFGHERGAFTGAIRLRKGRFELAHRGTLLMDEISEMAPAVQAKLLRVLQEKEFERVGGSSTLRSDARVIATTNKDLAREIREERFRSDLYYRLSVFPISLPPLRARRHDIPLLARHFLRLHSRLNGLGPKEVSPEAMELMTGYRWPGNVRQLENCLERAAIVSPGGAVEPQHLPDLLEDHTCPEREERPRWLSSGLTLREMETRLLIRTLDEVGGNRTLAASRLGISARTLRNKLHQIGQMDYLKSGPK